MAKRVYELWKGSNKFFLGGRLIFGPDARSLLLITLLLVIVPVAIFCVFVAIHLRHQFSPHNAGYAVIVAPIVFAVNVLMLLLLTSARDPGIVPRNAHPPEEEYRYDTSTPADIGGRQTPSLQLPRTKEVMVNGIPVRVKYCDTCMLYRPPRCSHCSICDNCVERFDHHCPWVGQCIGLRNYRFFFCFISSATLLCIYVFAMCAFYIKAVMDENKSTVWRAIKESPASVVLMAYCFISLWFVGGLTGFHSFLILTNQTTYENFRYRADNKVNIYDRGCLNNVYEVFCTEVKPSRNNFRAFVQEEGEAQQRLPPLPVLPTTAVREDEETEGTYRRTEVEEDDLGIGQVSCMGAEGQQILYDHTNGASSSRSGRGEDPRIAQMQRKLEEQRRALEEQRKKDEETRARLEAMERILSAGFRFQPQPYILHPEQTPQVPHMGGYFRSNSASEMPSLGSFQDVSFQNLFQTSGSSQGGGSQGGGSRGGTRGGQSEGQGGGSRGGNREEDETEDDYLDYDEIGYYHNGRKSM
ncbi:unnamed protein product [Cuscuta epithymum]|uniref:S-acyltransferase n=1 Tax=Cuscuta epithymum TaxID=186058 RepID=A0AAV0EZ21_9ASTE|nr:unnamed protein product [Cuscuta epithymum]